MRKRFRRLYESIDEAIPQIYVGTYGKYNNGSIDGDWVDLTQFSSKDEFYWYCVDKLHRDDPDPELMFQDYEYIPREMIEESWVDENLWELINWFNDENDQNFSWRDIIEICDQASWDADDFISNIDDTTYYSGVDSVEDIAADYIEECGIPEAAAVSCFDYEMFGRDVAIEYYDEDDDEKTAYEAFGVDEGDDEALGEEFIEQIYGSVSEFINAQKDKTIYIDVKRLANMLEIDFTYVELEHGILEIH